MRPLSGKTQSLDAFVIPKVDAFGTNAYEDRSDHEEEEVEVAVAEDAQVVLEVVAQHVLPPTEHFSYI